MGDKQQVGTQITCGVRYLPSQRDQHLDALEELFNSHCIKKND